MLGKLRDPLEDRDLDFQTCSSWEIVLACIRLNPIHVRLFSDLYSPDADGHCIMSSSLVTEICNICDKESLLRMTQEQVRTIFAVAGNKILNVRHRVKITRAKVTEIVREAISVA